MSSHRCKGQAELGKKIWGLVGFIAGLILISFLLTRVVPLLPIPISFLPYFVFFILCLVFMFFYAAYKTI